MLAICDVQTPSAGIAQHPIAAFALHAPTANDGVRARVTTLLGNSAAPGLALHLVHRLAARGCVVWDYSRVPVNTVVPSSALLALISFRQSQ